MILNLWFIGGKTGHAPSLQVVQYTLAYFYLVMNAIWEASLWNTGWPRINHYWSISHIILKIG